MSVIHLEAGISVVQLQTLAAEARAKGEVIIFGLCPCCRGTALDAVREALDHSATTFPDQWERAAWDDSNIQELSLVFKTLEISDVCRVVSGHETGPFMGSAMRDGDLFPETIGKCFGGYLETVADHQREIANRRDD